MTKPSQLSVLHIASGDLWAGAEVQLFTLAKTLHNNLGTTVNVVLLNHGELEQKLRNAGIDVTVLNESKLNGLQILHLLVRLIREKRPNVIHTHRIKENILGSIATLFSGAIPTLRTTHGAPEHRPSWMQFPSRIFRSLDWFTGRFMQRRVVSVSDDLAMILERDFPPKKIRIIENGIDLESIQRDKISKKFELNPSTDVFRIGFAGRLVPIKRVDLFIQAARYTLDLYPNLSASFHIYGDGPARNELTRLSHELKCTDAVHFEGHCENISQKLQELDVLMMTSDHEGLPMVLLEAMALRVPVIAHAVGGITKLLDQGSCGVLVHDHNAPAYAHEIYNLASNPQLRLEISEKALERVTRIYSAEQNAHAYLSEYFSICKQNV